MEYVKSTLKSRTVWTIVALFIVGGTNAIDPYVPESIKPALSAVIGLLGIYFRTNPQAKF